jgi:hypothetical protein
MEDSRFGRQSCQARGISLLPAPIHSNGSRDGGSPLGATVDGKEVAFEFPCDALVRDTRSAGMNRIHLPTRTHWRNPFWLLVAFLMNDVCLMHYRRK